MEKLKLGALKTDSTPYTQAEIDGINKFIDLSEQVAKEFTLGLINKETADQMVKDAISKTEEAYKAEVEALREKLINLGTSVQEMKINGQSVKSASLSIAEQLKAAINENKSNWELFKSGKIQNTPAISVDLNFDVSKASANMTTANVSSTIGVVSTENPSGLIGILDYVPIFISSVNSGTTNSALIRYAEKKNRDGSTVFISEGAAKNKIDFDVVVSSSTARKVADYIKVSDEMLDDVDFMASEIENELRYQVLKAADNGVLSGDGNAPNLSGITTSAPAYTLTTVLTSTPNNYDCFVAAATQIEGNNAEATHVFVNPVDYANMKISKGTTGHYVLVNGEMTQLPYRVVKTNQIPVGSFLMGDMRKSIVRILQGFSVSMWMENDDFTKNLRTIRGEIRLHHYIPSNHAAAFVYDQFADVLTAIEAA